MAIHKTRVTHTVSTDAKNREGELAQYICAHSVPTRNKASGATIASVRPDSASHSNCIVTLKASAVARRSRSCPALGPSTAPPRAAQRRTRRRPGLPTAFRRPGKLWRRSPHCNAKSPWIRGDDARQSDPLWFQQSRGCTYVLAKDHAIRANPVHLRSTNLSAVPQHGSAVLEVSSHAGDPEQQGEFDAPAQLEYRQRSAPQRCPCNRPDGSGGAHP